MAALDWTTGGRRLPVRRPGAPGLRQGTSFPDLAQRLTVNALLRAHCRRTLDFGTCQGSGTAGTPRRAALLCELRASHAHRGGGRPSGVVRRSQQFSVGNRFAPGLALGHMPHNEAPWPNKGHGCTGALRPPHHGSNRLQHLIPRLKHLSRGIGSGPTQTTPSHLSIPGLC
jgi:hypothetical protein